MAISSSDLAIAIGEDAFNAGWEACRTYFSIGTGGRSIEAAKEKAWDDYVPPAELCGEDFDG